MRGSKDSTASRVTRGAGSKGGKKKLAIDASVAKKLSAAHRGRGRRGANNAVARNFQSLAKPLKWPGKATDVIPVEGEKILSLSNKTVDCSESEERLERGLGYITGLYQEGPQKSPKGLVFRGGPAKEVKDEFELERAQLQKIKKMWNDFSAALTEASSELYNMMSDILGQATVLDLGEKDWYEELNVLDPSRPRFEEDALLAVSQAAEDTDAEAFL